MKELIEFQKREKESLQTEKNAMEKHTEELIKILTNLENKKPEKKKKNVILNKTQKNSNKQEKKIKFNFFYLNFLHN